MSNNESIFECNHKQCGFKAKMKKRLFIHRQLEHNGMHFPCDKCDYATKTKGVLMRHVQAKHEKLRHYCDECGHSYAFKQRLTEHIKKHRAND